MSDADKQLAGISLPKDFEFGAVPSIPHRGVLHLLTNPSLGPIAGFAGSWMGNGFNTIFRPNSQKTPTAMPGPVTSLSPKDNVLELNLTSESLTFTDSLGTVPNRGSGTQEDIKLNGLSYLQTIQDITIPGHPVGIHVEPGLWMVVPATSIPNQAEQTVVRMASIPHGTTIQAQGTAKENNGPPNIPAVDITPFFTPNGAKFRFDSQTATNNGTLRIPQDLTSFIAAGSITQAMLDDPNSVLRDAIAHQTIIGYTQIDVAIPPQPLPPPLPPPPPPPVPPLIGGGADNIGFLIGDVTQPLPKQPNAQVLSMSATFYIEKVEHTIVIPIFHPGQPPLILRPEQRVIGQPTPSFTVTPPKAIPSPIKIKFRTTQIQYTQTVMLNFAGLTWPHVSVATLVPASPIPIPTHPWP
ncbi:MAG: heme-binding protein [Planctomycetota bacterium]|nr:heme-binding protein [Planctomycetota bacterium]